MANVPNQQNKIWPPDTTDPGVSVEEPLLKTGDLYFNTTSGAYRICTSSSFPAAWAELVPASPFESRVSGEDEFDDPLLPGWQLTKGENAGAQVLPNTAAYGIPGTGILLLSTSNNPQNGVTLERVGTGLVFDDDEPIRLEARMKPIVVTPATPGAAGSTSALTDDTAIGANEILGVPVLAGEDAYPFFMLLDNGVDQEYVQVQSRNGTTLSIDGVTTFAYTAGDTAAHAGSAVPTLTQENEGFNWFVGLNGGSLDTGGPAVVFGGLWDGDTSTLYLGLVTLSPFTGFSIEAAVGMPVLAADQAWRVVLTVGPAAITAEVGAEDGDLTLVATASPIAQRVYRPVIQCGDGDDNRYLLIDYVKWSAARRSMDALGAVQGINAGSGETPTAASLYTFENAGSQSTDFTLSDSFNYYTAEAFSGNILITFPGGISTPAWWFVRVRRNPIYTVGFAYDTGQSLNDVAGPGTFNVDTPEGTYLVIRRDLNAFFVIPWADAGAATMPFSPTTPSDWDTAPTTVQAALDELASRLTAIEP